jgi:hypothetical protein
MGYSKSIDAFKKIQPMLDQLLTLEGSFVIPTERPDRLAYQIREGMYALKFNAVPDGELYEEFMRRYAIKIKSREVFFELKNQPLQISEIRTTMQELVLPNLVQPLAIVGAAIKHKAPIMHFPDADVEGVETIKMWADNNSYEVEVKDGVTMRRNDE